MRRLASWGLGLGRRFAFHFFSLFHITWTDEDFYVVSWVDGSQLFRE